MRGQYFVVAAAALLVGSPLRAAAPAEAASPQTVVARFLDDYVGERADAMAAYVGPDAMMLLPFAATGPVSLRGAEALAYFKSVFDRYASITASDVIVTPAADGRTVFVEAAMVYTDHAGVSHRVGNVWAVEVVDGKIVRSRTYTLPVGT